MKKILKSEKLGVAILVMLTIFAGCMAFDTRVLKNKSSNTNKVSSNNYSGSSYNTIYDDDDDYFDYYDYYYDDDYNSNYWNKYDSYDYYDRYYDDDYYYDDDDNYYDRYYKDDYWWDYDDTTLPSIKYSNSTIIKQYSDFDPMDGISAYHQKFGDVSDIIEVTYNNVNTNIPGGYTVIYKACNYPGSIYCRTVTKNITVKSNENNNNSYYNSVPRWSDYKDKSCTQGTKSCKVENLSKPTAEDPYSGRDLDVYIVDGYLDINTPGTYTIVYGAVTENGVSGTISRKITINKSSSSSTNLPYRKYISKYYSSYYSDENYSGRLEEDENQRNQKEKMDYEWENVVTYQYKCTNKGEYGLNGWTYVKNITSDNHPTQYFYDKYGYSGTLSKESFRCTDTCETEDISAKLGNCDVEGQYKNITRTWVGVYSGTIYNNNYVTTYSGWVYLNN